MDRKDGGGEGGKRGGRDEEEDHLEGEIGRGETGRRWGYGHII